MSHFDDAFNKYNGWRDWNYIGKDRLESLRYNVKSPIPPNHGVYIIRACVKLQRIKGASDIIYIGQSGGGKRKGEQGIGPNGNRPGRLFNLRGLDEWIRHQLEKANSDGLFILQCYFTNKNEDPETIEKKLLLAYMKDHWELPPGNRKCSIDELLISN